MTTQMQSEGCTHPARDLVIVGLASALIGALAVTAAVLMHVSPFAALAAGGASTGTTAGIGVAVLAFLKRG
ncbi:hypothetical protein ABZ990_25905 [Streptomyces sp. NPDC046203]|uniref:hypothetical protein n=1 Tax=Streptomyces sp. NPDC046203 TaxID=3154602 RepID=UPI0033EABB45